MRTQWYSDSIARVTISDANNERFTPEMVLPEHIVLEPLAAAPASRRAGGAAILQRHPRFCSASAILQWHPRSATADIQQSGRRVMAAAQQLRAVTFSV